jgi:hypothetical protein
MEAPWLSVNHTRLVAASAVPTPLFALEVQRAGMHGHSGAEFSGGIKNRLQSARALGPRVPCASSDWRPDPNALHFANVWDSRNVRELSQGFGNIMRA